MVQNFSVVNRPYYNVGHDNDLFRTASTGHKNIIIIVVNI